ncbi:AAA family ATPase [Sporomusa acidovorans]|uniref:AAA family ATPase n=1 Tax=Sporomusa acidovorans TaxID=112900 RepID=UPI00201299DF|nr:AAA family ATPase [Sporomusa acidovorans]
MDKVKALQWTPKGPDIYGAINSLVIGQALHTGIEKDVDTAIKEYFASYPVITDHHIDEAIKLEYLLPKVKEILPEGQSEVQIMTSDFIGFIDRLTPNDDGTYDIYDFKYSNNIKNYLNSHQLHVYKYFYEKMTGKKIRRLYFVFVPKIQIKQKKTEDLRQYRERIKSELEKAEVKIIEVEFNYEKVIEFMAGVKHCLELKDFNKNPNYLCDWCEYQEFCEKGWDYMLLPENKRRNVDTIEKKVIWLYGSPFSGKTHLANQFPDPLMLNTDGNIRFVDSPFIAIKDIVKIEGRVTKKTLAWEVFKDAIAELEKKQNDFKTIVVDLLEDTYEHCRLYMYDKLGITHESDDSFRAWDKVRSEFLNTLKRLMNLDYENIVLISHEDTSKDITKKGGDKVTSIKPNINDKCANKVAGMVDIVARVIADGDVRTLSFKTNEVIFGGGRLTVVNKEIPLEYSELIKVYEEVNSGKKSETTQPAATTGRRGRNTPEPEKPAAQSPTSQPEEMQRKEIADKDRYFYHSESDSYWMVKKGEELPIDMNAEISIELDKVEWEDQKKQAEAATSKTDEKPAEPAKPEVKSETPPATSTRRTRKPRS